MLEGVKGGGRGFDFLWVRLNFCLLDIEGMLLERLMIRLKDGDEGRGDALIVVVKRWSSKTEATADVSGQRRFSTEPLRCRDGSGDQGKRRIGAPQIRPP